jgi:pentose-5-phosphate-3-epimerase
MLTLPDTRIGVKGQGLAEEAEGRLGEARAQMRQRRGLGGLFRIADGSVREDTVPGLRRACADSIVMRSSVFGPEHFPTRMASVHGLRAG